MDPKRLAAALAQQQQEQPGMLARLVQALQLGGSANAQNVADAVSGYRMPPGAVGVNDAGLPVDADGNTMAPEPVMQMDRASQLVGGAMAGPVVRASGAALPVAKAAYSAMPQVERLIPQRR